MAQAAIAPDIHQHLDVLRDFPAKITFDLAFAFDDLAKANYLRISEKIRLRRGVELRLAADVAGRAASDAVDVRQRDLDPLVAREVDPRDSRHSMSLRGSPARPPGRKEFSALPLLVLRIFTDHPDDTTPSNDPAPIAHLPDR